MILNTQKRCFGYQPPVCPGLLVSQRIPEAAGELLAELRTQAEAAAGYHRQIDARLAALPSEIATGVDLQAFATGMCEALRQQLVTTGLRDSALLLDAATKTVKAVATDITQKLKPATDTLSTETAKLVTAAGRVQQLNEQLIGRERSQRWMLILQACLALLLFVGGWICGILI